MSRSFSQRFLSILLIVCLVFCFVFSVPAQASAFVLTSATGVYILAALIVASGIVISANNLGLFSESLYDSLTSSSRLKLDNAAAAANSAAANGDSTFQFIPDSSLINDIGTNLGTISSSNTIGSSDPTVLDSRTIYSINVPTPLTFSEILNESWRYSASYYIPVNNDFNFVVTIKRTSGSYQQTDSFGTYSVGTIVLAVQGATVLGTARAGRSYSGRFYSDNTFRDSSGNIIFSDSLSSSQISIVTWSSGSDTRYYYHFTSGSTQCDLVGFVGNTTPFTAAFVFDDSWGESSGPFPSQYSSISSNPSVSYSVNPQYVPSNTVSQSTVVNSQPIAANYPINIPVSSSGDETYYETVISSGVDGLRDYSYTPSGIIIAGSGSVVGSLSDSWPSDISGEVSTDATGTGSGLGWAFNIPILGWILKALKAIWDLVKAGFNSLVSWLQAVVSTIAAIPGSIAGAISNFWNGVPNLIQQIKDLLSNILQALQNLFGYVLDLGDWLVDILALLTGYTFLQPLFSRYLPSSVFNVAWTMILCAIAIWLLRFISDR